MAMCTTPPQDSKGYQLARLNKVIEAMNEAFREITAMHENAMEDLKQERHQSDTEEVIATVATVVNSIKNQALSMSKKYRKKWRGKDKHRRYSLRSTPTKGEESFAENSHGASITSRTSETKSEATAGLVEAEKDRHPLTIKVSKSSENLESAGSSTSSLPTLESRPAPTTEAAMEASDSSRLSSTEATVQLLTDPTTVEVLRKLLKQFEKLTAHSSE